MRRASPKQLRIGGVWADRIAPWGDLTWQTKWGVGGGGLHEIKWEADTTPSYRPPVLHGGALVELFDGPARLGAATLEDPDVASGSFVARGLYRRAEDFLCLDAAGDGTSVPNTAIDRAIVRGLEWNRPASISATAFTGTALTAGANYLNSLLDAYVEEAGTRWYVDAALGVRTAADQTTPTWYLQPDLVDLGATQDGYASSLFGRYQSGSGLVTATAADALAGTTFGTHEEAVDLTSLGTISAPKATAILTSLLADKARPAFTARMEVTSDQLTTPGGVPADLSMVEAGQVVRVQGIYDDIRALGGRNYLDFVIGDTDYADQSEVIQIGPLNLAPRDLRAVIAASGSRVRFRA